MNAEAVVYNKRAFEKAGIEAVPTTKAELLEACTKLKDAGLTPFQINTGAGWPMQQWDKAALLFAARFVGAPEINALPVRVARESGEIAAHVEGTRMPLPSRAARFPLPSKTDVILAVRPDFLTLGTPPAGGVVTPYLPVTLCEPTGSETFIECDLAGVPVRLKVPGLARIEPGERVNVGWNLSNAHLFDAETGAHL